MQIQGFPFNRKLVRLHFAIFIFEPQKKCTRDLEYSHSQYLLALQRIVNGFKWTPVNLFIISINSNLKVFIHLIILLLHLTDVELTGLLLDSPNAPTRLSLAGKNFQFTTQRT